MTGTTRTKTSVRNHPPKSQLLEHDSVKYDVFNQPPELI
jgi:hypothetical protein